MTKIAAIQMASGTNVSANLNEVSIQISKAAKAGARLVVLPENFSMMGLQDADQVKISEEQGTGPIQDFLSAQAIKNNIWIIAGTIPIKLNRDHANYENKVYAACLVYNEKGEQVSRYDKVHLFDVHLEHTKETYSESKIDEIPGNIVRLDVNYGITSLRNLDKEYARKVLLKMGGNKTQTAKLLGISRPKLDILLKN